MKAAVLEEPDQNFVLKDIPKPIPGPGEVIVEVKAAAINRRDWWIAKGQYAGIHYPCILGSDGAGIVKEIGPEVDQKWLGEEVMINPSNNWGDNPAFQGSQFQILGLPDAGTFAQFVKVNEANLHTKPTHLNWPQAAAIPLAGLTAFRALFTKAKAKKGDRVLITGIGGGTAYFALIWAVAAGCDVFVTSGSGQKVDLARNLGAIDGVNYKNADWATQLKNLAGGFDIVIDSALGDNFAMFPDLCKPGARIVFFGGTLGNLPALNGRAVFWKQISIHGTTMGNNEEFTQMLDLINAKKIAPAIDQELPLTQINAGFQRMGDGNQFGKIILIP